MRVVKENLNWGTKSELKAEVLRGIKEIGSVLYWMGLLDVVLVSILVSSFHDNMRTCLDYLCLL
jgi:cytoplasmic FMR1 interacting protein